MFRFFARGGLDIRQSGITSVIIKYLTVWSMNMTPKEIQGLRKLLGCTQEDFATVLGITKTSVARYEMENGPRPAGETKKKIEHLHYMCKDDTQKAQVLDILKKGGVAALATLLTMGAATFVGVRGAALAGITVGTILSSPAATFLGSLLGAAGGALFGNANATRKNNKGD